MFVKAIYNMMNHIEWYDDKIINCNDRISY